jgi:hypothetical protein
MKTNIKKRLALTVELKPELFTTFEMDEGVCVLGLANDEAKIRIWEDEGDEGKEKDDVIVSMEMNIMKIEHRPTEEEYFVSGNSGINVFFRTCEDINEAIDAATDVAARIKTIRKHLDNASMNVAYSICEANNLIIRTSNN